MHFLVRLLCIPLNTTEDFPVWKKKLMRNLFCDNRHEKSANEQFLTELSKWVFHERGHLKVRQKLLSCRPDIIMFIN